MIGKKPLGIMIAVGKPGPPPPKFRAGGDEPPAPQREAPTPQHEAAESPEYEANEEYGAKLVADIEEVGQKHGIDPPTMKSISADLFEAVARCLRGKDEQEPMAEQSGEGGGY